MAATSMLAGREYKVLAVSGTPGRPVVSRLSGPSPRVGDHDNGSFVLPVYSVPAIGGAAKTPVASEATSVETNQLRCDDR